jgi:hypothetical protein
MHLHDIISYTLFDAKISCQGKDHFLDLQSEINRFFCSLSPNGPPEFGGVIKSAGSVANLDQRVYSFPLKL